MATAQAVVSLANAHVGEKYVLGAKVPKGNPEWTGPWDCAEFTSWIVFQATGALFGCRPKAQGPDVADAYTGFWMDDARKAGALVSIAEATATAGAFLLSSGGRRDWSRGAIDGGRRNDRGSLHETRSD